MTDRQVRFPNGAIGAADLPRKGLTKGRNVQKYVEMRTNILLALALGLFSVCDLRADGVVAETREGKVIMLEWSG